MFADYGAMLRTVSHVNLGDVNATLTSLSNRGREFWKSPRVTLIRIEVLVVLVSISMLFLILFGSWRRRSRNFFIQKFVLAAFTLSPSLVTYILGSMQSSAVKSSMYLIWATSLYVLFGCANSITAYSLDDNNQLTGQIYQYLLSFAYILLIANTIVTDAGGIIGAFLFSWLLSAAIYKYGHRLGACLMASASWNLNSVVADYMYQEHTNSGPSDPVTMKGYHYLVDWPLKSKLEAAGTSRAAKLREEAKVIDIEKIWQCENLSPELRDACLAFSLFHLLRRRFFGFECAESSQQKTHDFVFKGLLATNEAGAIDHDRVFKVLGVELAFMYDFFFTKYAAIYYGRFELYYTLTSIVLLVPASIVTAKGLLRIPSHHGGWVIVNTTAADIIITVLILVCIALLQVLQLLHYWTTIWGGVSFACQRVRRGYGCMGFKGILTKIGLSMSNKCYYEQELGQYSLIDSVSSHPNQLILTYYRFLEACRTLLLIDPMVFHNKYLHRPRLSVCQPGESIKLPVEVKEAVVQSLKSSSGTLTNGKCSVANRTPHLLWAFEHDDMLPDSATSCSQKKGNQVYLILTWHIATCYCEMGAKVRGPLNLEIATKLSKYCAYLVVSAPELLPGHHYHTRCVFEAVANEAMGLLRAKENKYMAMMNFPEPREMPESGEAPEWKWKAMMLVYKGVRLGKQLEEMEEDARWKLLAEFWAELILYLAPSDNVKEHIECLAKGGEFITQLWALLSHAGILKRDHRNVIDIENAGVDKPCSGEGSFGDSLRFRHASSYPLTSAEKRAASVAACSINQPATSGNYVQPLEISVEVGGTSTCGEGNRKDQIQGEAS